jgi:hypothetical protein
MAGTISIPLTTLAPGTHHFGPAPLADSDSDVEITLDRTVPGGLNAVSAAVSVLLEVDVSYDGGATWTLIVSEPFTGGLITDRLGNPVAAQSCGGNMQPGTGRQGRATVATSGGSVAVAGSLVIS